MYSSDIYFFGQFLSSLMIRRPIVVNLNLSYFELVIIMGCYLYYFFLLPNTNMEYLG